MTEPGSGSDRYAYFEAPDSQLRTVARRANGGWVLSGMKHFISNGGVAKLTVVYANTDPAQGLWRGSTMFLVPAGTPGFRIGRLHEKVGQRLAQNAELIFEDCWLPEDHVLGEVHRAFESRGAFTRGSHVEAGATVLGVARAAYEAAQEWASTRVQGGRRIIEHQAVAVMLADMGTQIEAARALIWKAAWAADRQEPYDQKLASMAKVFASEVAHRVAVQAAEVFGGMGIMTEGPAEKLVRDALTFLHSDGTNQIHRVRMGRQLDRQGAPVPAYAGIV
jgi:alkylation response protein AidB-like acyl-CoA dehydrogenase